MPRSDNSPGMAARHSVVAAYRGVSLRSVTKREYTRNIPVNSAATHFLIQTFIGKVYIVSSSNRIALLRSTLEFFAIVPKLNPRIDVIGPSWIIYNAVEPSIFVHSLHRVYSPSKVSCFRKLKFCLELRS